jgi:hypothetical protein
VLASATAVVVIAGFFGTVIVAVPVLFESVTDVAVTVTVSAESGGAGAVYVAVVAVWFDSVPPPLTVQVTPPGFPSFATVAVSVAVFVPSTVDGVAVTVTLTELPPQPDSHNTAQAAHAAKLASFLNILAPENEGILYRQTYPRAPCIVNQMRFSKTTAPANTGSM